MHSRHTVARGCAYGLIAALALAGRPALAQAPAAASTPDDLIDNGARTHQHRRSQDDAKARQAAPPPIKITPEPWPRLDPGAILCRTDEDLRQHQAAVEARLDGTNAVPEPVGCSVVRTRTAVDVVDRAGPARTQVRLTNAPTQTGWTDAFLPDKPGAGH